MGWSSFTEVTDQVVAVLDGDADLKAFCKGSLFGMLKVMKAFKERVELSISDLPVIMLTVSGQDSQPGAFRVLDRTYTIVLYCGFNEADRTKGQDYMVRFEELVEQALLKDTTLGNSSVHITPGSSATDMGFNHPQYFIAKEFKILIEREF